MLLGTPERDDAIVAEVIAKRLGSGKADANDSGTRSGEKRAAPEEASPFRRRAVSRRTEGRTESASSVVTSAAEAHSGPNDPQTRRSIDGHFLWMAQELKRVSFKDRRTQEPEDLPVLPLLISDPTGPIAVELWRDAAADNFDLFKAAYEAAQNPGWGACALGERHREERQVAEPRPHEEVAFDDSNDGLRVGRE